MLLNEKNVYKSTIFMIGATLIHPSALVIIPLIIIAKIVKSNRLFVSIVLFFLSILFILYPLLFNAISIVLSFLPAHYYTIYFQQDLVTSLRSLILSSILLVAILMGVPKDSDKLSFYFRLSIIGLSISLFSFRIAMIHRISDYFTLFYLIGFLVALKYVKSIYIKYASLSSIVLIYSFRYISFFTTPLWQPFWNYRTILELFLLGR